MTGKEKLRNLVVGSALVGILAGCVGERTPPTPNEMACSGFTASREAFGGVKMVDFDCDGSIDIIRTVPTSGDGSYILMLSSIHSGARNLYSHGAVIMTPRIQELVDSIYSLQKRLYFLEDSTRYWANETGDTTNLRGSLLMKTKNRR